MKTVADFMETSAENEKRILNSIKKLEEYFNPLLHYIDEDSDIAKDALLNLESIEKRSAEEIEEIKAALIQGIEGITEDEDIFINANAIIADLNRPRYYNSHKQALESYISALKNTPGDIVLQQRLSNYFSKLSQQDFSKATNPKTGEKISKEKREKMPTYITYLSDIFTPPLEKMRKDVDKETSWRREIGTKLKRYYDSLFS